MQRPPSQHVQLSQGPARAQRAMEGAWEVLPRCGVAGMARVCSASSEAAVSCLYFGFNQVLEHIALAGCESAPAFALGHGE